jgi:hypothetical protein
MLEVKQEVVIYDTGRDTHLSDMRVQVRGTISNPWTFLPEQELHLTKQGAEMLISALQSALELIGQDFIVHHDGSIAITHDDGDKLVDTNYNTLADYQIGLISVQG